MNTGTVIAMLTNYCDAQLNCSECPCSAVAETLGKVACDFGEMRAVERDKYLSLFMSATPDNVNHPKHYELPNGMQVVDVEVAKFGREAVMAHCLCTAAEYILRSQQKNGVEDIKKAHWWLCKYLELEGSKDE